MDLENLKTEIIQDIEKSESLSTLDDVRVQTLGKKGKLTAMMKQLGGMAPDERKEFGQSLNIVKQEITALIEEKVSEFKTAELNKQLETEKIDVTLSARPKKEGKIHPISQTIDELTAILGDMGFAVAEGPDVDSDFNNFTALNIPESHPARQGHDTFYMPEEDGKKRVLRTHTSPVQIRTMMSQKPPIRIICPGRTYRNDSDATHSPMFHQIEALIVDKTTTMANLKWVIEEFLKAFFELDELPIRLRPHCFPFTEPSAEIDISYTKVNGNIKIGKGDDWLEVAGCGMVHPKVLENCGIDSSKYQGFAFGFGIERLAMLKYGIPDLRTFFEADLRWLEHYGFSFCQEPNLVMGKK